MAILGLHQSGTRASVGLPAERASVRLMAPGVPSIPARVLTRKGSILTIVSIIPMPAVMLEELASAAIEFGVRGGRVRLEGHFEPVSAGSPELLRLSRPRVTLVSQERSHERVNASRPVWLYVRSAATPIRADTIDISGGGMLVRGAEALRAEEEVEFELFLNAADPPTTGTARVVRAETGGRRGLVYETLDEPEWQRVIDFVEDRLEPERLVAI